MRLAQPMSESTDPVWRGENHPMTVSAPTPGANLGLPAVPNLRDIGGHETVGGAVVRTGLVFRAGHLDKLDVHAVEKIHPLGIRTIFDLRTESERKPAAGEPFPGPPAVERLDVLADYQAAESAHVFTVMDAPERVEASLGNGRAAAMLVDCYEQLVVLPSAQRCYGRLFRALADDDTGVALFHCSAGKDRTGWATAILLTHLGVDEHAVRADYLASNSYVRPAYREHIDSFAARGGDPAVLIPLFEVDDAYLDAGFAQVRATFGDVDGYLREGLGLDDDTLSGLTDRLVTR